MHSRLKRQNVMIHPTSRSQREHGVLNISALINTRFIRQITATEK